MFAIIETGGKQYKVEEGQTLLVDLLGELESDNVTFDNVLLVNDGETTLIGTPNVDNASVDAVYLNEEKGTKINVFKMKRRKSFMKKTGHRQHYAKVKIVKINAGQSVSSKTKATAEPVTTNTAASEE